jgi:succinate dehydrogenase cytochrome b556 subunit
MERPLSPFMFPTWYRFQITSTLSILHRLTGIALAVGSILLAWWLVAVAAGGECHGCKRISRHPIATGVGAVHDGVAAIERS